MLPPVTIQICTYNRPKELTQTLYHLYTNLYYEGELRWLICDDNSPDNYLERIRKQAGRFKWFDYLKPRFVSTPQNVGWGGNVNYGMSHIDTDYIFFVEDDYLLMQELDLRLGVAVLQTHEHLGMMRYRGTAGDKLVYQQREADIAHYLPEFHQGLGLPGKITYLQIDSGSPSVYLYSHGAHLKRRKFHEFYGYYPVGLKLGETEESYGHTVKDQMLNIGAPGIAIFPEWIPMWWDHCGHSYQGSEHDKGYNT